MSLGLVLYIKSHSCVRQGTRQICPFGALDSSLVGLQA